MSHAYFVHKDDKEIYDKLFEEEDALRRERDHLLDVFKASGQSCSSTDLAKVASEGMAQLILDVRQLTSLNDTKKNNLISTVHFLSI